MMTSASDYKLYAPPSGIDIRGEIVPVADIEGRTPTVRTEDVCYLAELGRVFTVSKNNPYLSASNPLKSVSTLRYLLNGSTYDLLDTSGDFALKPDCPMTYEQTAEKFHRADIYLFKDYATEQGWIHASTAAVAKGAPIRADDVRTIYRFLGADYYHRVYENTAAPNHLLKGILGCTATPTEYSYPTRSVNSSDEVVDGTATASTHNNGTFRGGCSFSVSYLERLYSRQYCNFLGVPSSTVSVPFAFDTTPTKAYALLTFSAPYRNFRSEYCLQVLRELTAGESGFSLDLFRPDDATRLLEATGYGSVSFGEWTTDATLYACSLSVSITALYAKYGQNAYCALPEEWDWSPSAD